MSKILKQDFSKLLQSLNDCDKCIFISRLRPPWLKSQSCHLNSEPPYIDPVCLQCASWFLLAISALLVSSILLSQGWNPSKQTGCMYFEPKHNFIQFVTLLLFDYPPIRPDSQEGCITGHFWSAIACRRPLPCITSIIPSWPPSVTHDHSKAGLWPNVFPIPVYTGNKKRTVFMLLAKLICPTYAHFHTNQF